jgi:hypothetical protein
MVKEECCKKCSEICIDGNNNEYASLLSIGDENA